MNQIPKSFTSLEQCASATGIPLGIFRTAKRRGCPGFRFGRIYLLEFLAWHFSQPERLTVDLQVERGLLTQAQRIAQELENAQTDGRLHNLADVEKAIWFDLLMPLLRTLENMPGSIAPIANPNDPALAQKTLLAWVDKIRADFYAKRLATLENKKTTP